MSRKASEFPWRPEKPIHPYEFRDLIERKGLAISCPTCARPTLQRDFEDASRRRARRGTPRGHEFRCTWWRAGNASWWSSWTGRRRICSRSSPSAGGRAHPDRPGTHVPRERRDREVPQPLTTGWWRCERPASFERRRPADCAPCFVRSRLGAGVVRTRSEKAGVPSQYPEHLWQRLAANSDHASASACLLNSFGCSRLRRATSNDRYQDPGGATCAVGRQCRRQRRRSADNQNETSHVRESETGGQADKRAQPQERRPEEASRGGTKRRNNARYRARAFNEGVRYDLSIQVTAA